LHETVYLDKEMNNASEEVILLHDRGPIARSSTRIQQEDVPLSGTLKSQRPPFWYTDAWLYEIMALGFAVAVLVALVITFARYDKQPNPLWASGITLNTIASIASMLFRLGIMLPVANCISQLGWIWYASRQRPIRDIIAFDQASRGPLGGLYAAFTGAYRSV